MPAYETPFAFAQALLENDQAKRVRNQRWALRASSEKMCELCLKTPAVVLTRVVPYVLGGDQSSTNVISACKPCAHSRGKFDPLDPAFLASLPDGLSSAVHEKRRLALLHGRNHLTEISPWAKKARLEARLNERYQHARFRAFASVSSDRCFIGWLRKHGSPVAYSTAAGILRHAFKATFHDLETALVFEVEPAKAYDALWALIEQNGLVLPLGEQEKLDEHDWRRCWSTTFSHLGDNLRRFARGEKSPRPWPARTLSTNKATVRSRRRKSRIEAAKLDREKEMRLSEAMLTAFRNYTNPNHRMAFECPPIDELADLLQEASLLRMDKEFRRRYKQSKL